MGANHPTLSSVNHYQCSPPFKGDFVGIIQGWFGYFAETKLLHSTWMDPSHPILYDYLAGRGQGVYLFFTSFTNQFFIQIIGIIYIFIIAAVGR